MVVYIMLYVIMLLGYVLGSKLQTKRIYLFQLFLLSVLLCFRGGNVGVDTKSYISVFNTINSNGGVFINEYGYVLFSKLVYNMGGTQQLIFLLYGFFTIYFFSKFILRYSSFPYMSLLIFVFVGPYYLASFNQVRQYLAIAVFLGYLLPLIEEKEFLKFLFSTLIIAFFSHLTLLLVLPLYFFFYRKWSWRYRVLMLGVFVFGVNFLVKIIEMSRYGYFLIRRGDIEVDISLFVLQIFIALIIFFFERRAENRNERVKIFFNMCFMSILMIFPIIFTSVPAEVFARMNNYFFPFMIILLPEIINLFDKKSQVLVNVVVVCFLSLYYFKSIFLSGIENQLVPYEFNFIIFA